MGWRWQAVSKWLKDYDPLIGAEIGVKEGRFIGYLLKEFPGLEMYAIDPWEAQPNGNETYHEWDFNEIYSEYQKNINGNEDRVIELKMYSHEAAELVPDWSLDFVFIDAQHDYESVKRDIELWEPKVKPGGLISGHDYEPNFPGVIQAVNEKYQDIFTGSNAVWGKWVE